MRKPGTRLPRALHLTQGEADALVDAIVCRDAEDEGLRDDEVNKAYAVDRNWVVRKLISAGYEYEPLT